MSAHQRASSRRRADSTDLLAVLRAVPLEFFKGIADAITAPVATRRRRIGAIPWAERSVLLFGIITFAIATGKLFLIGSKSARIGFRRNLSWCFSTLAKRRRCTTGTI